MKEWPLQLIAGELVRMSPWATMGGEFLGVGGEVSVSTACLVGEQPMGSILPRAVAERLAAQSKSKEK